MRVGQKVLAADGNEGIVTRLRPGDERPVEVRFDGPKWWYPYRAWFTSGELVAK